MSFLLKLFALVFSFNQLHVEMETLIFDRFTFGLQTFEQILHAHTRAPQELAAAFNDTLIETQAIGNRQRITPSWQTNTQSIGRRERLDIKLDRSIHHSRLFVRKRLEF